MGISYQIPQQIEFDQSNFLIRLHFILATLVKNLSCYEFILFLKGRLTTINPKNKSPFVSFENGISPCPMHFNFHNYNSWIFFPVYSSEGILKNDSRKFGLFTGKVTINYLTSTHVWFELFSKFYVICGGSTGSENYGTSSLWFKFHCQKPLLFDKRPMNALINRSLLRK